MKNKFIVVSLLVMLLSSLFTVDAETVFENVSVNYDRTTGLVDINGTLVSEKNETIARLMVLKPGTDAKALIDGTLSFKDCGVFVAETEIAENAFDFESFKIGEQLPVGDYVIRISAADKVYVKQISVATEEQAKALMDNVNTTTTVKEYIERYNDVYKLEVGEKSLFKELGAEGEEHVLNKLCNREYDDLDELRAEFNKHVNFYKIFLGPWGSLDTLINNQLELLGVDLTDFNDLSSTKRDQVYKNLCGTLYTDENDFKTAFVEVVEEVTEEAGSSGGSGSGSSGSRGTDSKMYSLNAVETALPTEEPMNHEFQDLDNYEWAKESINLLQSKGIINGRGNGIFDPETFVTRAEAVKMIILALGEIDSAAECDFADVDAESWAYSYVATAVKEGIINGYGNGYVGINDNITREDLATLIVRAASCYNKEIKATVSKAYFEDMADISSYATEAVEFLQQANVINGMNGCFYPKLPATRAQTAKMIAALIS